MIFLLLLMIKITLVEVKSWLSCKFDMKDMGEASYVLGVEIHRDRNKRLLGLSQKTYLQSVIKRFSCYCTFGKGN